MHSSTRVLIARVAHGQLTGSCLFAETMPTVPFVKHANGLVVAVVDRACLLCSHVAVLQARMQ